MSTEANKAIACRYVEENWNKGDLASADEIFAADCLFHVARGGVVRGVEELKRGIADFRTGFPDIHITIEDVFADENKVAMRCTCHATHTGKANIVPHLSPTGKQVTWGSIEIHHIKDGKIAESWRHLDRLGLLQQLEAKS